jgi:hypothetical protein
MAESQQGDAAIDPQDALRLLEDVRSRLRTVIWALHGMHQDLSSLTVDDLADLEHLMTETVEQVLAPAYEAISQMIGANAAGGGAVTTH